MTDAEKNPEVFSTFIQMLYNRFHLDFYTPEEKNAMLRALCDALNTWEPISSNSVSDAEAVMFSLDPRTQQWAAAGFTADTWQQWSLFGFEPKHAKEWNREKVPFEYALHFDDCRLTPAMYKQWATIYPSDSSAHINVYKATLFTQSYQGLTINEAHKWAERGIGVYDAKVWLEAGYTPSKANKAIREGVSVQDIQETADANMPHIPGSTWPKIRRHMEESQWNHSRTVLERSGYTATLTKSQDRKATIYFNHRGQVKTILIEIDDPHTLNPKRIIRSRLTQIVNLIKEEAKGVHDFN